MKIAVYANGKLAGHIVKGELIPLISGGDFWSSTAKAITGGDAGKFLASPMLSSVKTGVNLLGLGGNQGRNASDALGAGATGAIDQITSNYPVAQKTLTEGYGGAETAAKSGFQKARSDQASGTAQAKSELSSGMGKAIDTAKSGYEKAQGYYDTPEMVSTRNELYSRILGQGGMNEATLENERAKAREEYGTGLRGASDALSAFQGESSAPGLAGENLARAAAQLGTNRANAIRDINIANEQLKRQEQTGAMGMMEQEAGARAGLSAQEADAVSGLQEKLATGIAGLTTGETAALSQLAAQEGTTVADLKAKLASGQAVLTTEEAKALAEIITAESQGQASIAANEPGVLGSILKGIV